MFESFEYFTGAYDDLYFVSGVARSYSKAES